MKMTGISILIILTVSTALLAAPLSPDEIIDSFYTSRKFMKKTAIECLGSSRLSNAGMKATADVLYDYTVVEVTKSGNTLSYAEIDVKKRSVTAGIVTQKEFWKMAYRDGQWIIENIYTPEDWQMKKIFRSGSSLPEKVEALASFEFEYEVEDVPPGTPIQKAFAYASRRDFVKAYMWANISVNQKGDAESIFVRGLLSYALNRQKEGERDLKTAIQMDRKYYYILQNLINQSSSGGGSANVQGPSTRTVKGGVQSIFQK
jgi:hypothetical protein